MKLLTSSQMRNIDKITIEERGISGLTLMERAGVAVANQVVKRYAPSCVAVFIGKGNNGGDGSVVARILSEKGVDAVVFVVADPSSIQGDAKTKYERIPEYILKINLYNEPSTVDSLPEKLASCSCVVDGLLGTGIEGEVQSLYKTVIDAINMSHKPVIAIDIPSGLQSDTGNWEGACIKADLTITMGAPKIGLYINDAYKVTGEIFIADIGFPKDLFDNPELKTNLTTHSFVSSLFPKRDRASHKGNYGHLFVISGSRGFTGASTLVAEAALRTGAGLVTLGIPKSLNSILEVKLTEAMTLPLYETTEQTLSSSSFKEIRDFAEKSKAIAIGPGLSTHSDTAKLVRKVLLEIDKPMVVDADGINSLDLKTLSQLSSKKSFTILTPHPKELSRLIKKDIKDIQADRIKTATEIAVNYKLYLVLKGFRTVVSAPDGTVFINDTGNPGMAKGGSGDVLTGIIGSLLAQGFTPFHSAICGVYIHGLAGDYASKELTEAAMIPTDIINYLPKVFQSFET